MYSLINSDIEKISGELTDLLEREHVPSEGITKIRLTAEELLIKYRERYGTGTEFEFSHSKRLGKVYITFKIKSGSFNPLEDISEEDFWLQNILMSMGYVPSWRYRNNCNELCFSVKGAGSLPSWAWPLIACGLGAAGGFAARLLPGGTLSLITEKIFNPVSEAIMGFFSAVSIMLIFLSVINGIVGMVNLSTLRRIGRKMLSQLVKSMLLLAAIDFAVFGLVFNVSGGQGSGFDFGTLWNMILDIIPDSFFDPFNTGNALQILFLSVFIGYIMLRSVNELKAVADVAAGLYRIIQDMMMCILKVLPAVVFISVFNLLSGSADIDIRAIYKFPLIQLILSFGWIGLMILRAFIRQGVKPSVLIKKILPVSLLAFSTASSNASLTTSMETCEKKLGIDPDLVKVGIPLFHTVFTPTVQVLLMCATMCMAQMFSVDISWTSLATMSLAIALLAVATPPVPGGGISVIALLFTIYGVPLEALSIIISMDVITDRIVTCTIVTGCELDLIQLADSLSELDKDVLRS